MEITNDSGVERILTIISKANISEEAKERITTMYLNSPHKSDMENLAISIVKELYKKQEDGI